MGAAARVDRRKRDQNAQTLKTKNGGQTKPRARGSAQTHSRSAAEHSERCSGERRRQLLPKKVAKNSKKDENNKKPLTTENPIFEPAN